MTYPIRLLLALLLLFSACTDKDKDPVIESFAVSGIIQDSTGKGVENIRVYFSDVDFVQTNSLGFWQISVAKPGTIIRPEHPSWYFKPATQVVSKSKTALNFIAKKMTIREVRALEVAAWFGQIQLSNGLVPSSENGPAISLYDNALAALVFLATGNTKKAEAIFNFFDQRIDQELLEGNGGFAQFRDAQGKPTGNRWLGDNAWLLIALQNYAAKVEPVKYTRLRKELSDWIRLQQDSDGGLWGGYKTDGSRITKVTEGMLDAFHGVSGYDDFHKNLLAYLRAQRWNSSEKLLVSWPGNVHEYALDNHAWGYCMLEDFPYSALEKTDRYTCTKTATVNGKLVTGYSPDIDRDIVWPEGTGQMAVAFQNAGRPDLANEILTEMEKLLIMSPKYPGAKGIPYASNPGTGYGTDPLWEGADLNICVSSGAWYLFAALSYNPYAWGYRKGIPASEKFWLL